MSKGLKALLPILISCCAVTTVTAQHTFPKANLSEFNTYQDSLIRISDSTFNSTSNESRFEQNAVFIKTLVNALKINGSFNYGFDSLKNISILKSPDNIFKIFSWQLPVDDGTYRFFGAIQLATKDGKLKLFPLIDETEQLSDANQVTDNKNWFGARYYEIVPVKGAGGTYYALLGWKGNNQKTSKKVIEILSFVKDAPVFGKNVFDQKTPKGRNRMIYEYNKLNTMTLKVDKQVGMIILDHLAPFTPDMEGNFEYYASDLSFDGYRIVGGRLRLVEDVELKNDPNDTDELYIDPKDKNITPIKKI